MPDAFGGQAALMLPAPLASDGIQVPTERKGRAGRGGTLTGRLPAVSPQRTQVAFPALPRCTRALGVLCKLCVAAVRAVRADVYRHGLDECVLSFRTSLQGTGRGTTGRLAAGRGEQGRVRGSKAEHAANRGQGVTQW